MPEKICVLQDISPDFDFSGLLGEAGRAAENRAGAGGGPALPLCGPGARPVSEKGAPSERGMPEAAAPFGAAAAGQSQAHGFAGRPAQAMEGHITGKPLKRH